MNILGLLIILLIYSSFFYWSPIKTLKHFLLFTGIISIPFEFTYSLVYWGPHNGWASGIAISLSEVSFFALSIHVLLYKRPPYTYSRGVIWSMVVFLFACVLSVQNSVASKLTLYQVLSVMQWFVLYYIVFANCMEHERDLRAVMSYLALAMILQGIFCFLQLSVGLDAKQLFATGHHGTRMLTASGGYMRTAGTFPQPNALAEYLVPLIVLQMAVAFGANEKSKLRRFALTAALFGLLSSFSRGGWLSLAATVPLLVVVSGWMRPVKAVMFACLLVGLAFCFEPVRERIFGDDHNSANSRWALIHLAMNMIKAHPIVGIGANTFANQKYHYVDAVIEGAWLDEVHNTYLLVFAETGVIGITGFLAFLISYLRESRRLIAQSAHRFFRSLGFGLSFGLAASMLHMFVDMTIARSIMCMMFLYCGMVSSTKEIARSEYADQDESFSESLNREPERATAP